MKGFSHLNFTKCRQQGKFLFSFWSLLPQLRLFCQRWEHNSYHNLYWSTLLFKLHFSIYKLECINEKNTNYTKNITCYLKTISRGLNVLTSLSDFVVPLNFINANIIVVQKSSANTYRSVIINNTFDVCEMLGDRAPPMLKFTLPLISKFAPDLVHPCPYQGKRIGVENLPIDFSLLPLVSLSNVPKGDYRVVILIQLSHELTPKRFS